jgi:basic membrane protein A and related proteins
MKQHLALAALVVRDDDEAIVFYTKTLGFVRGTPFEEHEVAYIIGVIAAMTRKTGAVLSEGMDVPLIRRFEMGYEAGAKAINPKASILAHYCSVSSEAWNHPPEGEELALAQCDAGADVIFAAASASGLRVFEAAEEREEFAIGVNSNRDWLKPGFILTSMIKRVDLAVIHRPRRRASRHIHRPPPALWPRRQVDSSVDPRNEKILTQPVRKRADESKAEIIAGKIVVPDDCKKQ